MVQIISHTKKKVSKKSKFQCGPCSFSSIVTQISRDKSWLHFPVCLRVKDIGHFRQKGDPVSVSRNTRRPPPSPRCAPRMHMGDRTLLVTTMRVGLGGGLIVWKGCTAFTLMSIKDLGGRHAPSFLSSVSSRLAFFGAVYCFFIGWMPSRLLGSAVQGWLLLTCVRCCPGEGF